MSHVFLNKSPLIFNKYKTMPSILITRLVSLYMFSSILWLFGPKEKFINCSLISYVFLVCWFGFLKTYEKKKNPLFSLLVSILTGQYGCCSEAEDYVIWVLLNLLRFLLSCRTYSVVYFLCLSVCVSIGLSFFFFQY